MTVIDKYISARDAKADQALAAALLHDVGHGPFSHAFEKIGERFSLKMAHHETVSDALIRDSEITPLLCSEMGSGFANDVADMVSGSGERTIYSAVVSSQFDADRLDYMRRDRLMTGSQHAGIDFEWLVENLEVAEVEHRVGETPLPPVKTFVLGRKAIFAAEAYVLGLFQLYPTVYLHKATRGAEKIYVELLARTFILVKAGLTEKTGLPATHPLVKFSQSPENIDCALALDDTVIWGALSLMADAKDICVSMLARRLRDRKLYKCIDVRAKIAHDRSDSDAISEEADKVCENIKAEITKCLESWSENEPDAPPKCLLDEADRSPYREMYPEDPKAPLNQVNIRTEGDRLVDLSKRSEVVAKLGTYKSFRVYYAEDDEDTKRKLIEIIDVEIRKWPA
jgi:HD superfamily phosphohydrolase